MHIATYLSSEEAHASKSASHVFYNIVSPGTPITSKEIKSAEMVCLTNMIFRQIGQVNIVMQGGDDRQVKRFEKELYRFAHK